MPTPNSPDEESARREQLLAEKVAAMVHEQLITTFYKEVGKAVVNRFLIIVGAIAVAFALGKGWISPGGLK